MHRTSFYNIQHKVAFRITLHHHLLLQVETYEQLAFLVALASLVRSFLRTVVKTD
jgi:hypothetical protein